MRNTKLSEKIKTCNSKNLKSGGFKQDELEIYNIHMTDKEIILKYQELLPILNLDNSEEKLVNARDLHNQLEVKTKFADWIKDKIEKYDFEEDTDYILVSEKKEIKKRGGDRRSIEYSLTLSMAKELAMVQNNDIGKLTRKYFQAIERAYKNRENWNYDRADTLISYKPLKQAIIKYYKDLLKTMPSWARSPYQAECCMYNNIIMGMSATEYRNLNGLDKNVSIRNTFSEKNLEYIAELEKYDADLIIVQNIFDYDKRQKILTKKYSLMD